MFVFLLSCIYDALVPLKPRPPYICFGRAIEFAQHLYSAISASILCKLYQEHADMETRILKPQKLKIKSKTNLWDKTTGSSVHPQRPSFLRVCDNTICRLLWIFPSTDNCNSSILLSLHCGV